MTLLKAYWIVVYYLTLVLFALVGAGLNAVCLAGLLLPRSAAITGRFQGLVHRACRLFIRWMRLTTVCRVQYDPGFDHLPPGLVVVGNHPGLMDITYLLARIPRAICLFKPSIRRNPVFGCCALRAGYVPSQAGVDTIRAASAAVAAGSTLVLFPEGTRTPPGQVLGPLRPGFAAIAQRAGTAIQLVRIRCNSNVLAKGWSCWEIPILPIRVQLELGPRLVADRDGVFWAVPAAAAVEADRTGAPLPMADRAFVGAHAAAVTHYLEAWLREDGVAAEGAGVPAVWGEPVSSWAGS
ncbi:lysophospholipid acyltransferase family protein [Opitutus sp. ER46]|uniref:lysophospholipid acyltransferase family protein n=1 Tax=Opitutus sp. ER46 TaxID=2161864 RepID=UPI000D324B79|nr:lysophospholipid acyltransferase family protein [Opitutus sp. ER46]PTY00699.1 hypothetical protein DB354_01185 [Opitutus sp. ER46]